MLLPTGNWTGQNNPWKPRIPYPVSNQSHFGSKVCCHLYALGMWPLSVLSQLRQLKYSATGHAKEIWNFRQNR